MISNTKHRKTVPFELAFVHCRIYIDMFTSEVDVRSQELRSRTVARKEIFKTCWRGHFDSAGDAELATKSVGACTPLWRIRARGYDTKGN